MINNIFKIPFNENEADREFLLSKPACFIVLGKPGVGKATLAQKFAKVWKCVYLTIPDAIQYAIDNSTEIGEQARNLLMKGEAVSEEMCFEMLKLRIKSPEVQHYGYILNGILYSNENSESVVKQIKLVKNLTMKPDYIISFKITDEDLVIRRQGMMVDPITNKLYTKETYSKWELQEEGGNENMEEGSEEEEDEFGEEEEDEEDFEEEEEEVFDEEKEENSADLLKRLVTRYEEFDENIYSSLAKYKQFTLLKVEDFIGGHDQQKVFELDGNLPQNVVFKNLVGLVQSSFVVRPPVPMRLQSGDDSEEIPDDAEIDEMMRSLATSEIISPGYRWRRSKWGHFCPVSLADGSIKPGIPQYAVGFLDKMYLMASENAMERFFENPRKFLLPPLPCPPCKIVILGAPISGVTTLANKLKSSFDAEVFDMDEIIKPRKKEIEEKIKEENYAELLAKSIAKVQEIENEKQKEEMKKTEKNEDSEEEEDENSDNEVEDEPPPPVVVTEEHPMVQQLISEGVSKLGDKSALLTPNDYLECLEDALNKMWSAKKKMPYSGGWILDNFPKTKDQLNIMVEHGIVPDDVIVFREDTANNSVLESRWDSIYRPKADSSTSLTEDESVEFLKFKKQVKEFDQNWTSMQSAMRNAHNLEPLLIPCHISEDEAFTTAFRKLEGIFKYHAWEYSGMDQDEEEEDMAAILDEEMEEEEDPNKRKPFGETQHFCPVALKNDNVLWPGSPDCAAKYRESVYFFSTNDAKDMFIENPENFLPQQESPKVPPVRLLLLGAKGAGKTFHGRVLAQKFNLFHISFEERLQELIIHKTKKKIGPNYEFPEDKDPVIEDVDPFAPEEPNTEETTEEEEKEDTPIEYTAFEENIRNNILDGEPLQKETLDEIIPKFWKDEPFKSQGFLLEGFPRTAEEVRYLSDMGCYPDGALYFNVDDTDICNRLLPPVLERWRKQQQRIREMKEKIRNEKLKKKEEERTKRKAEKTAELEERKAEKLAARQASGEADDSGEISDEEIDIDALVDMEMLEEYGDIDGEEEEEEETEEEALERIKVEIVERFEEQMNDMESLQETLQDVSIPIIEIDASRKFHITQYLIAKTLQSQVTNRENLFDRCHSVSPALAKRLINHGYKLMSKFGKWCPVQMREGAVLPPNITPSTPSLPVIYRRFIYFLSSEENKEKFIKTPTFYLQQSPSKPLVPIRVAIIGPPKSGKTSLANRFVREYGVMRISIGEALRKLMETHGHTHLAHEINEHLIKGYVVPDELAVRALELCLLDPVASSRGYVLDGYPVTSRQMDLLRQRFIIPYKVINLTVPDKIIMQRGLADRKSPDRVLPLHDSHTILAIRIASHRRECRTIKAFYKEEYRNLYEIDGEKSKWWIFNTAKTEVERSVDHIQTYIERTKSNKAASVKEMCLTPKEIQSRLGEFGLYCAIHLYDGDLFDCGENNNENDFLAEYRGKYFKFCSQEHMEMFLENALKYISPLAPNTLPPSNLLPIQRSGTYARNAFPVQFELQGYCPVTYVNGEKRYEALVPGDPELLVEYKSKLYCFFSNECLTMFMRQPKKYCSLTLPNKLPPKKEPMNITALPMLGYLEQAVSTVVTKALTSVGCIKPKHPFLTAKQSAILYLAYYLKAHNPKATNYVRDKYKKKLQSFEDNCELITYLSKNMRYKYCEPEDRPIDFNHKLTTFVALQQTW